jgi:hypothetical protein
VQAVAAARIGHATGEARTIEVANESTRHAVRS